MAKKTTENKQILPSPNDELQAIWDEFPDVQEVYQVGKYYFFELHYAENYARLIDANIQTHTRNGKGE